MVSISKFAEEEEAEEEAEEEVDNEHEHEYEYENASLLRNGKAFKQVLEKLDVKEIAKPLCEPQTVILHFCNL